MPGDKTLAEIVEKSKRSKCPFCGRKDLDLVHQNDILIMGDRGFPGGVNYYTECLGCRARGPVAENHELALSRWVALKVDDLPAAQKMDSDPELDALVAEKVMGWTRKNPWWLNPDGTSTSWMSVPLDDADPNDRRTFEPSKDIEAAWEVAEKLGLMVVPVDDGEENRIGWAASKVSVEKEELDPESGGYLEVGTSGWMHAETAPLAICRAAIALVQER